MKIAYIHCHWKPDGVSSVVLNNIQGLQKIDPNLDVALIGNEFVGMPNHLNQIHLNLKNPSDSETLAKQLQEATAEYNAVIIENPMLANGIDLTAKTTKAYKLFSESTNQRVFWRHHDGIQDRPEAQKEFKKLFGEFKNGYAKLQTQLT